jgi:hypothetical protein
MRVLREITDWDIPNHIYFASDDKSKIYAYIRASGTTVEQFKKPIRFSTSHRKFTEIPNQWGYVAPEDIAEGFVKTVTGSTGERYTITELSGVRQCSCAGFRFRNRCRHVIQ